MVRSHVREEELSRDEVVALEGEIDGAYEATPLPAMSYHKAVWAVLSVSEDILRTVADAQTFLQVRDELPEELKSGEHLSLKISDKLDGTKFALNEAIKSFRARLQRLPGRPKLTFEADDEKVAAFNFLSHSESYANAVRKFLGFHKGMIRVLKHDDHSAEFVESPESRPYSLLENLCWPERKRAAGDEKQSAIDVLVTELNSFADPNSIGREVASKTQVSGGRLRYNCITKIATRLQSRLTAYSDTVPKDWKFPWGSAVETMCIWRALCTRAIYHMLAIHWHATRSRLREGGINQVCLVLDRLTLIEELSRISGLEKSRIERFVVAITYGTGTKNPDPALQPIVPVGDGMLAVPTFHVTSSNYERNLLSLHARIDPASFNASSFVFERMMTDKLLAPLLTKFPLVKANFKVPDGRKGEEVDVLLVDPPSRTMILLELRWMLAPGDAEEVIKRVRICGEKIDQLRRKVLAARDHFVELTQILKLGDPSGWSVSGIVVIDGFAGAPPQTGFDIPLVPQPVFLAALRNLGEGRYLHQYFASGCWLPEEGRDYLLESRSQFLLGSHIRETHFSPGPKGYFEETIPKTAASFASIA